MTFVLKRHYDCRRLIPSFKIQGILIVVNTVIETTPTTRAAQGKYSMNTVHSCYHQYFDNCIILPQVRGCMKPHPPVSCCDTLLMITSRPRVSSTVSAAASLKAEREWPRASLYREATDSSWGCTEHARFRMTSITWGGTPFEISSKSRDSTWKYQYTLMLIQQHQ